MNHKFHEEHYQKARELVSQMTLEEKTSQLCNEAPAIERLGIPSYGWWNEGLHGVARAGVATIFPQSIGLAAMFDQDMMKTVGDITALEGRIKYNWAQKNNDHSIYRGLTFWSPNINIYRDPRWGRGHETFGEDPYLTSVCAENYIKGLQGGEDERYMKAAACAKHFAAHSGPEGIRHGFNSEVSNFDLHDTYLPAFEWCIKKADVEGIMGAYNMINGVHCCANEEYMEDVMRQKWGFKGYYVSDCGALADMHMFCLITHTAVESAALALKSGCDLNCGQTYLHVLQAYNEGLVTEEEIDRAVIRIMATRFKLGLFDKDCVYNNNTDYLKVECKEHLEKAYEAAVKSTVLFKNNGILPLKKDGIQTIGVIGPNAANIRALEGNYNGTATTYHTVLDGIKENCGDDIRVLYSEGCHLYRKNNASWFGPSDLSSDAMTVAQNSDVIVMCLGLDSSIEGEQGDACNEFGAGDKPSLSFPGYQVEMLEKVKELGKPIILVVLAGGALDLNWSNDNCDAILYGWYPGTMGGSAIADIIFGKQNPSGKTPVTFYRSLDDIPAFEDYNMEGRTYRYLTKKPLYEFGYGLSYTSFETKNEIIMGSIADNSLSISVDVSNTGKFDGDAVVKVYATYGEEKYKTPNKKLCGFTRLSLTSGETKTVTIAIDNAAILLTDQDGSRYLPQTMKLHVEN
ncbi:glycoside hydrolase family 3 C-terminal domain-containing protein [Paludicola sp. MB14-C6]|uniref:glycoside hydrolase family 3 C-terminal domain-containing protein n=1 Tax=Paludihabitans sp. MB14-C6 TaxID=3070656 RepID=UPI0027DB2472|nr:glycoside hydrolase family 3 C-terminal domain-containing protein [Paludicola sp. MB14-C6]WMJ21923.1 glycoside hydrolase family 3 C-terminal domain-containing protein [Paludicola sp. MB14-C6]